MDKKHKIITLIIVALSLAGLILATYLTYEFYGIGKDIKNCPIFEDGCSVVLNSKYSVVFDLIPVALLGVAYYFIMFCVNIIFLYLRKNKYLIVSLFLSLTGVFFSIYLLYVQYALIGDFCFYCVLSAMVSIVIFILESYSALKTFNKIKNKS